MNSVFRISRLSAILLFAAAVSMPSGEVLAKEIVLGASVQLTGPVANTGRYYRDAYQLAVDRVNAAGGVKIGNESYKLALKLYDNQSDANLSVRQYTQLVSQDRVDFLLGPFASNFALADSAVSEKYRIPMVQGGGASDQIFSRGFKFIFGTLAPASNYFASTIEMLTGLDPAWAKFGYDPDYHAASGVADVEALVQAAEMAGSTDPAKVRDALSKVKFDSLYGPVAFNANGQIDLPQTVIQVQGDRLVAIYGGNGKIAPPKYPMPAWDVRQAD